MIGAIESLIQQHRSANIAVAFSDLSSGVEVLIRAREPFHPASTFKVAVMAEVFHQAHQGLLTLEEQIPVANSFVSIADGDPFSVSAEDDSDATLYARVGRTASIHELVRLMITTSSNFATNLLIQRVTAQRVTDLMRSLGCPDLLVLRGPEDNRAYARGMNNVATAHDLMRLMQLLAAGQVISPAASRAMVEVLLGQIYTEGIPAGIPSGVPVAHKTGWNERIYHDAAIILPAGRPPYVLVVMTQGFADERDAHALVAAISRQCYAIAHSTG